MRAVLILALGACVAAVPPAARPAPVAARSSASSVVFAAPEPALRGERPAHVRPVPPAPVVVRRPAAPALRFATAEAAGRYLARAYNRRDARALARIATPDAVHQLTHMRSIATDLRLRSCLTKTEMPSCAFSHGYPARLHKTGRGSAVLWVMPSKLTGWQFAAVESCG